MDRRRKRVLLVDADEDLFIRLRGALGEIDGSGFTLEWATMQASGAHAPVEERHDVVVIGAPPGVVDGFSAVRAAASKDGPPVIGLLRPTDRDRSAELIEAGAVEYLLTDQISAPLLERVLRYAIERRVAEERLRRGAFFDPLTELPNRAMFMDELRQSVARSPEAAGYSFAVLFVDLDRFKVINDSLGHGVGDKLLIAIAEKLQASVRPGDLVARLGGDEFTVIVRDLHQPADAAEVAGRIEAQMAAPLEIEGHTIYTTCSIGIAVSTTGYQSAEDLLRDADTAMYRAKAAGKARYEMFDPAMHTQAMALWQLEADLRLAVEREEFRVVYQPIVALADRRIVGVEALVRWAHPERGTLLPAEFLPLAEETGLIVPIGQWVLREACRQAFAWVQREPSVPPLTVGVNLSVKQLLRPELLTQLDATLQETRLPDHCLRLEVSEDTIVDHAESLNALMLRLRVPTIHVAVDGIGAGWVALRSLHRYPIDSLKIDRCFIEGLEHDGHSAEIVRSIVALGRKLGVEVIAVGVETAAQIACLQELGCDRAQGHFFGAPASAEEMGKLLARTMRDL